MLRDHSYISLSIADTFNKSEGQLINNGKIKRKTMSLQMKHL